MPRINPRSLSSRSYVRATSDSLRGSDSQASETSQASGDGAEAGPYSNKRDAEDDVTIIRKYANRRLYDTTRSKYITLDELADFIRGGGNCRVCDAVSGDDLTSTVLTQIVLGEGVRGGAILPVRFLHQLIALCGDSPKSLLPTYLEMAMDSFVDQQKSLREFCTSWMPFPLTQSPSSAEDANGSTATAFDGESFGRENGDDAALNGALHAPYVALQQQAKQNMNMFRAWLETVNGETSTHTEANGSAVGSNGAAQHNGNGGGEAARENGLTETAETSDLATMKAQLTAMQEQISAMANALGPSTGGK